MSSITFTDQRDIDILEKHLELIKQETLLALKTGRNTITIYVTNETVEYPPRLENKPPQDILLVGWQSTIKVENNHAKMTGHPDPLAKEKT